MEKYMQKFLFLLILMMACCESSLGGEAIPDYYKSSSIEQSRDSISDSQSEQIDPFTGNLQRSYVDISLPGNGGFDLSVVRSYNSSSANTGECNLSPAPRQTDIPLLPRSLRHD